MRDEAYLLLKGTMRTSEQQGGELVQPGVVVGEVAFLSGASRVVTTSCVSDCLVMVLSRIGFQKSMAVRR